MVKYTTAILLFAVAVFWPSVSARSIHGHYQEPHHGISVENDGEIEDFLKWALKQADDIPISAERDAFANLLHETKHRHWSSFQEFSLYLKNKIREHLRKLEDEYSRNKRSVESDIEESTDDVSEDLTADQFAKLVVLGVLVEVAPQQYKETLYEKLEEVYHKEFDNEEDFIIEVARVFKEVTGDDLEKYEDQFTSALETTLEGLKK